MQKMLLKNRIAHVVSISLLLTPVAFLSACSAIDNQASATVNEPTETVVSAPHQSLTADQIYRVLAAESLVHKGDLLSAAQIYLELAQRYKLAELAQRAYELAAHAGNTDLLLQATQLNTQLNPNMIEPWQVQVLLALRAGHVDKAVTAWQAFYHQSIERGLSDKAIFLSTATLAQDDLPSDVLVAFSQQLTIKQPSVYADFVHVMFLVAAMRVDDAYQQLERSVQTYPDQPELAQLMASLAIKLADGRGLSWLVSYVEQHPEDVVVGEQLGRLYVALGRVQDAKAQFTQMLAHQSSPSVAMSLALIELELNNAGGAVPLLQPLVDDRRYGDMAHYYLGQAYYFQQQTDAAMAQWQQITQGSYHLDALIWQVRVLSQQRQFAQAHALLDGFEIDSDDDYVRWVQAKTRLFSLQQRYHEAIELLGKAIGAYPDLADFWQERANMRYLINDGAGFEQDMRAALALAPEQADILNALGFYLADTRQSLTEARHLLDKANQLAPDKYYIVDSLGWLSYQEGAYQQALALLERAYQLKADPEILRHRLATLLALKQFAAAKQLAKQESAQFADDAVLRKFLKQMSLMP